MMGASMLTGLAALTRLRRSRPRELIPLSAAHGAALRRLRSWTLQEPQIERPEHQDNADVHYQPRPELVPEEQDVHTDHDGDQREHVKHDGCRSAHRFVLLGAEEWSKSDGRRSSPLRRISW